MTKRNIKEDIEYHLESAKHFQRYATEDNKDFYEGIISICEIFLKTHFENELNIPVKK